MICFIGVQTGQNYLLTPTKIPRASQSLYKVGYSPSNSAHKVMSKVFQPLRYAPSLRVNPQLALED